MEVLLDHNWSLPESPRSRYNSAVSALRFLALWASVTIQVLAAIGHESLDLFRTAGKIS
jgi:hypothetical protein